jgi:hypothetical protein
VTPAGNPDAFADAALRLLGHPGEWQRLSDNGRRWAGRISIESVVGDCRERLQEAWRVSLPPPAWPRAEPHA